MVMETYNEKNSTHHIKDYIDNGNKESLSLAVDAAMSNADKMLKYILQGNLK